MNIYNTLFVVVRHIILVRQLASIQSLNSHQNPGSHWLHQLLSRYHIEIYIHRHWYSSGYYDRMYILANFALTAKTLKTSLRAGVVFI